MVLSLCLTWLFCGFLSQWPCQNLSLRNLHESEEKRLLGRGVNPGVFRHITSRSGTLDGRVGGLGHCCVSSVLLAVRGQMRSLALPCNLGEVQTHSSLCFCFCEEGWNGLPSQVAGPREKSHL